MRGWMDYCMLMDGKKDKINIYEMCEVNVECGLWYFLFYWVFDVVIFE